ncbi:MAG TPA: response regulator transcription factor [Opitutus sp.]|nr:response regulator transcription factor [Opitutus sp.]
MSAAPSTRIRLVLVDDSEVVRAGLRALLGSDPSLEIAGEAGNVADGVALCARLRPDVALLDIRLPDGTGLDACRRILAQRPDSRVLILTSVADDKLVREAIQAGAHGYLLKEIDARGLVQAIRDVAAGKSILDPAVTARILEAIKSGGVSRTLLAALSPQENRVLALIAEGCTNKEVGARLGLSEKTVKNYLSTIFEKLQVSRRGEAAAIFARERS